MKETIPDKIQERITRVDINLLQPSEYNPRKASLKEKRDLINSLAKFGQVDPLIVNSAPKRRNVIIGGHFRHAVMRDMGWKSVKVVYVNIPDIKDEQELNLRLNKNTGSWDWDLLANFEEQFLADVGFSAELNKIFEEPGIEQAVIPEMELQAYEHYDYIVLAFKNVFDWMKALQRLGVQDVNYGILKDHKKIGLGRVLNGKMFLEKFGYKNSSAKQRKK